MADQNGKTAAVWVLSSEELGGGNAELGRILMVKFLGSLAVAEKVPGTLLLLNGGVRLALEGSPVLGPLRQLEARGVAIRACTTCLNFYQAMEKLAVGEPGTMDAAVAALASAGETLAL